MLQQDLLTSFSSLAETNVPATGRLPDFSAVVVRLDPIRCSLGASVMPLLDLSPGQVESLMSGLSYRKAFKKQLDGECYEKKKYACLWSLMCYAGIVLCAVPNRVRIMAKEILHYS